jgi:hypothetical protein
VAWGATPPGAKLASQIRPAAAASQDIGISDVEPKRGEPRSVKIR